MLILQGYTGVPVTTKLEMELDRQAAETKVQKIQWPLTVQKEIAKGERLLACISEFVIYEAIPEFMQQDPCQSYVQCRLCKIKFLVQASTS